MWNVPTVCSFCSNGCGMFIRMAGEEPVGVVPSLNHPVSQGRLCHRGWNRYQNLRSANRLESPLLGQASQRKEASWQEALQFTSEKISDLLNRFGPRSLGVIGSPWLTNEDNFQISLFARQILKTNNIDGSYRFTAASSLSALNRVFADPAGSTGTIPSLAECAAIVVVGQESVRDFSPVGSRIIQASLNGSAIVLADPLWARPEHFYAAHLPWGIETLAAALAERTHVPAVVYEALAHGKTGLVFTADQCAPASAVTALLSMLSQLSDSHKPRLTALPLSRSPNLRGAWDMGVRPYEDGLNLEEMLNPQSDLKGLLVFADDLLTHLPSPSLAERLKSLEFLLVADRFETETSGSAHVVLPIPLLAEMEGSMTNCEGRVQKLRPVRLSFRGQNRPVSGILGGLADNLGAALPAGSPAKVREKIGKHFPSYHRIAYEADLDSLSGILLPEPGRTEPPPFPAAAPSSPPDKYFLTVANTLYAWSRNRMILESPVLAIEYPADRPTLRMNPQEARDRKIRMGETVRIKSERGDASIPVEFDANLPSRTVVLSQHHAGAVERAAGKGEMDPETRSLYYPGLWVTLEKM